MPGGQDDPESPASPASRRPWVERPKFKLIVALVGLIATIVGIAVSVRALLNPGPAGSNAGSSTGGTSAVMAESSATNWSSSTLSIGTDSTIFLGPSAGECLSSDGVVVPCAVVHRFESIGTDPDDCDEKALVKYLGGNPDLDVPRVSVGFQSGACLVSSTDLNDWAQSVKGAFATGSGAGPGDELRRCEDDQMNQLVDVSCANAHTGEYVGVADGVIPDEDQCLASTEAYLGISLHSKPELTVFTIPTSDPNETGPHCIVAIRGNNVLTESIRNIRTRALPLSPR